MYYAKIDQKLGKYKKTITVIKTVKEVKLQDVII